MNGDVRKDMCGETIPTQDAQDRASSAGNTCQDQEVALCTSATATATNVEEDQATLNGAEEASDETQLQDSNENICELEGAVGGKGEGSLDTQNSSLENESSKRDEASGIQNQALPSTTVEPLMREKMKHLIHEQVQFFFSRENWSRDPFLVSQMDSDQYVPLYILADCPQFKSITKDHSIILEALKESIYVQLDEKTTRVRPNYERCIVLLREIPADTPKEDIEAMFQGEGCPNVVSCEFVHNDIWYVTFESDNDAQKAYTYLRESVRTFKDKPILARMKSKPVTRMSCLSVLPSYGSGRNQREPKDGPSPSSLQATGGQSSGPNSLSSGAMAAASAPTSVVPANFNSAGGQPRVYFPTHNNMNSPYNPIYPGSPIPQAYFYPNPVVQWAPGFCDMNSFIQFNGLKPNATYKPVTSSSPRYSNASNSNNNTNSNNSNRRNRSRDNRNDQRHLSGGSNVSSQNRHNPPNRPPSAPSPHPHGPTHTSQNMPSTSQSSHRGNEGSGSHSNTGFVEATQNGHNIFAQNDPPLASQSNLYTSFSPPSGKLDKKDSSSSFSSTSAAVPFTGGDDAASTGAEAVSSTSISDSPPSFPSTNSTTSTGGTNLMVLVPPPAIPHSNSGIQPPYAIGQPPSTAIGHIPPPPPPHYAQQLPNSMGGHSHRNGFNSDHHPASRDSHPQRQIGRGGRRRGIPRREDEVNGLTNNRAGSRGGPNGATGDYHGRNASDVKKPQFELKETSFPPLPGADEGVVIVPEEKKTLETTTQTAWSGESQKFSDVMKGTAKPKSSQISSTEKDSSSSIEEAPSPTSLPASEIVVSKASQPSSQDTTASTNVSSTTNNAHTTSTTTTTTTSSAQQTTVTVTTSVSTSTSSRPEKPAVREQRPPKEERRVSSQSARREREFNRDNTSNISGSGATRIAGTNRREKDPQGSSRFSGNKENRPQVNSSSYRSWREERPDSEGWITKGTNKRDTRTTTNQQPQLHQQSSHSHHSSNHHQQNYDNKNSNNAKTVHHNMVNGDTSPPPSPKPEIEKKKSTLNNTESEPPQQTNTRHIAPDNANKEKDETPVITENEKSTHNNNNDGEQKTSYAKMALASKNVMEKLSAELKEKDEQERQFKKSRLTTRSQPKMQEKTVPRDRESSKPFRREPFASRDKEKLPINDVKSGGSMPSEKMQQQASRPYAFRSKDPVRPKSPK